MDQPGPERERLHRAGGGRLTETYRGVALAIGAFGLAYALSTLIPFAERPAYLDTWFYSGVLGLTALLALARPVLFAERRAAWCCIGLAVTSWAFGDVLWSVMFGGLDADAIPVPSLADPCYLAMYPLAYAGLILLARAEVSRLPAAVWLDGLMTSMAAGSGFAAMTLKSVLTADGGSPFAETLTNLAYPIGDLVLLVVSVAVLAMVRWRPDPVWWLLAVGAAFFAVADTAYLFTLANGGYTDGNWIDGIWMVGLGSLAVAGSLHRRHDAQEVRGFAALLVPILFSLCALAVLVVGAFIDLHPIAIVLAGGCLIAAGARTALTFEQTRELARTRVKAETDELSGIGNRRLLDARLPAMMRELGRDSQVLFTIVTIDHVSEINGVLGYPAGDMILNTVGHRLLAALPDDAVCARLGGVEVAVLQVVAGTDRAGMARETKALLAQVSAPVLAGQVPIQIEMSAGVAIAPLHAVTPSDLIRCAADALRVAKASRSEVEVYDPNLDPGSRFGAALYPDLVKAIGNDEFTVYFQPKADALTGRPLALEGMLRWHHPVEGTIPGDAIAPLAARVGLTRQLTRTLLESAMVNCVRWRKQGADLPVAVDVTAADVLDANLPYDLARMINNLGLPPASLTLEIAEEVLLIDQRRTALALNQLRHLGIRLALDHYGRSAPSLARLRALPVNELKLDRSFIAPILSSRQDAAVVRSTVDLAQSLGIVTFAEGIDAADLMEAVTACGCAGVQGSVIGGPVTAEAVRRWLRP